MIKCCNETYVNRTNTAPSLGPVLGSALNSTLGWRAIFWFLTACSGSCLLAIGVSLPETSRSIVSNGSLSISGVHKVPFRFMRPGADEHRANPQNQDSRRTSFHKAFSLCLQTLRQKDKLIVLSTLAILYMTYACLQASLSTSFIHIYHFSDLQAGLIYLPFGLGCAFMAYLTGKRNPSLIDRD